MNSVEGPTMIAISFPHFYERFMEDTISLYSGRNFEELHKFGNSGFYIINRTSYYRTLTGPNEVKRIF